MGPSSIEPGLYVFIFLKYCCLCLHVVTNVLFLSCYSFVFHCVYKCVFDRHLREIQICFIHFFLVQFLVMTTGWECVTEN
jgi:hypothetical protein